MAQHPVEARSVSNDIICTRLSVIDKSDVRERKRGEKDEPKSFPNDYSKRGPVLRCSGRRSKSAECEEVSASVISSAVKDEGGDELHLLNQHRMDRRQLEQLETC